MKKPWYETYEPWQKYPPEIRYWSAWVVRFMVALFFLATLALMKPLALHLVSGWENDSTSETETYDR